MSEWKQNERRTSGFPEGIEEGTVLEVKFRDGDIERRTVGYQEGSNLDWLSTAHFNTNDGYSVDVMAYRVVSEPAAAPAITPPDYSKGFPVGTTAKDIGANVGDLFAVAEKKGSHRFNIGDTVKLIELDDGEKSTFPKFARDFTGCCEDWQWIEWCDLAPYAAQPKTAIELQAEEVGIPEPVQEWPEDRMDIVGQNGNDGLHYTSEQQAAEADKRIDDAAQGVREAVGCKSERVENDDEIAHDPDLDESIGKRVADAMFAEIMKRPPSENLEDDLLSAALRIKWESVFGLRDIADAARNVGVEIKFESPAPTTAPDFLQSALNTLTQRGKDYDKPEGERSAAAVAVAFNAITGKDLTDAEVYLVLQLVKDVRQWQCADYHADSALDCVAYAALKAEALAGGGK